MKDGHHSTEMGCAVTNPPKQKKIAMRWTVLSRQSLIIFQGTSLL